MSLIRLNNSNNEINKYFPIFFLLSFVLLGVIHYLFSLQIGIKGGIVILVLATVFFSLLNFNLSYTLLLVMLFSPYIIIIHQAVFLSIFVLIVAVFNFRYITKEDVNNPLLKPLLLYFLLILPSFFNTTAPLLSLRDSLNLIALISVFIATLIAIKDRSSMMRIFYFFVFAVVLHSLYVNFLGLSSSKRVFGLLGVYFVDFAGLGCLITFILILYSKGIKKIIFSISFLLISLGLILTQTRNAWMSTGFALFTLLIFLFINSKKYFTKRYVLLFLSIIFFGISLFYVLTSGVGATERLGTPNQEVVLTDDPSSSNVNSLMSRLMIWHTAVSAFAEHPIIGIGAYAFKHISNQYYVIPKAFYKLYVDGRTPHVTYLQVLTETGIIGFFAFIFFLFAVFRLMVVSVKLPKNKEDAAITLMIVWSFVYIIFSMMMTESWLYGQYIVWMGILMGLMVNNSKYLINIDKHAIR